MARTDGTTDKVEATPNEKYTKDQFTNSVIYQPYRDVVAALLDDDEMYTTDQVYKIIQDFLKGGN